MAWKTCSQVGLRYSSPTSRLLFVVCSKTKAALLFITLLVYPRFYPLRPTCLHAHLLDGAFRLLLHLSYDWSLCLAQLTPAYGVTSFRLIKAATALHHQHSVALSPLLAMGTRQSLLLSVFFLLRSLNHCASACHSSVNRLSGLRPVF